MAKKTASMHPKVHQRGAKPEENLANGHKHRKDLKNKTKIKKSIKISYPCLGGRGRYIQT